MITIVEARQEHVRAVIGLWTEMMAFHAALYPFYQTQPKAHERFEEFARQNIASPDSLVLVALDGSTGVGFSQSIITSYPPVFTMARYGLISDFAVTGHYRRRGIGTMMAGKIKEWFSDRGITRIELRVSTFNTVSRPFWEKQGFTEYEALMCLE